MPITASFYRFEHFFALYPQPLGYPRNNTTVGYNGQISGNDGIYRWFKEELGITKAAVFYYDIPESRQAGLGFQKGLELAGFSVDAFQVSFAAPSFDQPVATMQSKGTQIIVDAMDDGANRKLCDSMARRSFRVEAKVSTIVSMGDTVGDRYNDTCRNNVFIPGNSIPYSMDSNPVVREFRAAWNNYQRGQPMHQWALEAWTAGNTLKDYLERAGAAPTRKGFEEFLNGLRRYTAGGVFLPGLDWSVTDPGARTEETCFTVARWLDDEGGWVQATDDAMHCYPDAKTYLTPALEQGT